MIKLVVPGILSSRRFGTRVVCKANYRHEDAYSPGHPGIPPRVHAPPRKIGGAVAMWSAVCVSNGDGKSRWLTQPGGEGTRSVVSDFQNAAIFWRHARAEGAIKDFLRSNGHAAHEFTIVHLGRLLQSARSFLKKPSCLEKTPLARIARLKSRMSRRCPQDLTGPEFTPARLAGRSRQPVPILRETRRWRLARRDHASPS